MRLRRVFASLLFFVSASCTAQQCPPGTYAPVYSDGTLGQCSTQRPSSQPVINPALDRYGAVAVSSQVVVIRGGLRSREEAEQLVMEVCRNYNPASPATDCALREWFRNSCGSVAKNKLTFEMSLGFGPSRRAAETAAFKYCSKSADAKCVIAKTDCALPASGY